MNRIEDRQRQRISQRIHHRPETLSKFISVKRNLGYTAPGDLPLFDEAALRRALVSITNRAGIVGTGLTLSSAPKAEITLIRPDLIIE